MPPVLNKKYKIFTFGCQMNEYDSEVIAAFAENLGYLPVLTVEEADLIIINTCAVRKKPEAKVSSLLGKLQNLKQEKKEMLIAVGGCMTQQKESAAYIKERFKSVDLVFGTHALPRLPGLIEKASRMKETVVDIEEDYTPREQMATSRKSNFQAWLPVTFGCNNFCSYCVVPFVRGRERSRSYGRVLQEARELADKGYREITLLGQNVNSYGQDLPQKPTFAGLLADLDRVTGLDRIRFMTSHPKDLSSEMIKTVAGGKNICEHFHLPAQSGSDRILDAMNRRYTRQRYLDIVEELKMKIPGVSITTDIIVGFPGESEEDFEMTLDLLKRVRFDSAFAFIYSSRRNTAAEKMDDRLTYAEKEQRLQKLNRIQQQISREENDRLTGCVLEVMVEGPSKSNPDLQTGRTRTNKLVHFEGPPDLLGSKILVKITESRTWNLFGELKGE